jgi:hypothetical protein
MTGPLGIKYSREYEDGWLDAYGRRGRRPGEVSADYAAGYQAGASDRKKADK